MTRKSPPGESPQFEKTIANPNYHELVPLGKIRDLNKEESDRLLALDFDPVKNYEGLHRTATIVTEEINMVRKKYGLPELSLEADTVRLVPASTFDKDRFAIKSSAGGAFLHPANRKVFLRFDSTDYLDSQHIKMWQAYAIAHELIHRGMEKCGLSKELEDESVDLFRINEGITDYIARDILNGRVLSAITTQENINSRAEYIEIVKPEIEGFKLKEGDIIPVGNGEHELSYSRIPEIRLIEHVKSNFPELFEQLVELAFLGQREKASELILQVFGPDVYKAMMDRNTAARDLLSLMNSK